MNTKSSVIIYDKTNTDVFLETVYNDLVFNRTYDIIYYYDCKEHLHFDLPSYIHGICIHGEENETLAFTSYVLLYRYKDMIGNDINVIIDIDYVKEDDLYIICLQEKDK